MQMYLRTRINLRNGAIYNNINAILASYFHCSSFSTRYTKKFERMCYRTRYRFYYMIETE